MNNYTVIGTEIDGDNVAVAVLRGSPKVTLCDSLIYNTGVLGDWSMVVIATTPEEAMKIAVREMNK